VPDDLSHQQWERAKELFAAALERAPADRAAFLDQVCGPAEADVRREVETLLTAHQSSESFLSTPPAALGHRSLLTPVVLREGDLLGPYRLVRALGQGGMATVYLARDERHRRMVALKVLRPDLAHALGPERFRREIEVEANLTHPHILPLHDSGESAGLLYYVMPYIEGESLRDRLRRETQLPVDESLRLAREVADALAYAHGQGVVHRDIKPENILLSGGHALVADFGIAKALVASSTTTTTTADNFTTSTLTSPGLVVGTPAYMAPEQAASDRASDHRADLYALGCLAYELLTGRPPFQATSARGLFTAHLIETPTPVTIHRADVPPSLDQLILHLLAKDPAQRPQTAEAVIEVLNAASAEFARPVVPRPAPAATVAVAPRQAAASPRRRRPPIRALFAAAVAVGGGAIGYATFQMVRPATPTLLSTGVLKEREPLLVAEFENRTPDSLVGPAVTDAFRLDLGSSPVVTVLPPTKVSDALERMRRRPDTRLDAALARELAVREGIKAVLTGQVARLGGAFLLSAELVSPESGRPGGLPRNGTGLDAGDRRDRSALESAPGADRGIAPVAAQRAAAHAIDDRLPCGPAQVHRRTGRR